MDQDDFSRRWMSPGSHDLWGRDATHYKTVPFDVLPPMHRFDGRPFDWLRGSPSRPFRDRLKVGQEGRAKKGDTLRSLERIVAEASAQGLHVPAAYATLMTDAQLHERIPTCTGCYLDVPSRLLVLPKGRPGRLLRFMNDQQGGVLWFLHLSSDESCRVVCAVPEFDDEQDDEDNDGFGIVTDVAICADGLEEFVHRFWMENVLWFALYEKTSASYTPLTTEQQAYLDAVRSALGHSPS